MGAEPRKATRKPRADSLRNRERLLTAAAEIFRTGGPEASLEAVARRADVGIGTLYRHFPTREALFEAVYRREVESWRISPCGFRRRRAGRGAAALAACQCASSSRPRRACSPRWRWPPMPTSTPTPIRGSWKPSARSSERAVAAGAIRDDVSAEDLIRTLIGMCHMHDQPGWETTVLRMVDVFVDGMRLPPRA